MIGYPNLAGQVPNVDEIVKKELEEAGIESVSMEFLRNSEEVETAIRGNLHGWTFKRAWYYWVAKGPGIPPATAMELHLTHGKEVRVDGHCGCPSPLEWHKGFAVGAYHVDTREGLRALVGTLEKCMLEGKRMLEASAEPDYSQSL